MGGRVSVVIPTFKRAVFLKRAVESVLRQTYNNIEIIVVDDNDEDSIYRKENEKMLSRYIDTGKIIYIKHKHNKNGAAARNTGIREASGDYITFLDDDDYFLQDRIEKLVDIMAKNDGYDCAYSSVAYVKNGKIIGNNIATIGGNCLYQILKQDSFFGTGSNLFLRKSAVKTIGFFDEEFVRHQDMEYMVRFFAVGKRIIALDDILVVKCLDDAGNVPDFEKMRNVKEHFLRKFGEEIKSFNMKEQSMILFRNYFELLHFTKYGSKEYDEVLDAIKMIKGVNFGDKVRLLAYKMGIAVPILKLLPKSVRFLKRLIVVGMIPEEKKKEILTIGERNEY